MDTISTGSYLRTASNDVIVGGKMGIGSWRLLYLHCPSMRMQYSSCKLVLIIKICIALLISSATGCNYDNYSSLYVFS